MATSNLKFDNLMHMLTGVSTTQKTGSGSQSAIEGGEGFSSLLDSMKELAEDASASNKDRIREWKSLIHRAMALKREYAQSQEGLNDESIAGGPETVSPEDMNSWIAQILGMMVSLGMSSPAAEGAQATPVGAREGDIPGEGALEMLYSSSEQTLPEGTLPAETKTTAGEKAGPAKTMNAIPPGWERSTSVPSPTGIPNLPGTATISAQSMDPAAFPTSAVCDPAVTQPEVLASIDGAWSWTARKEMGELAAGGMDSTAIPIAAMDIGIEEEAPLILPGLWENLSARESSPTSQTAGSDGPAMAERNTFRLPYTSNEENAGMSSSVMEPLEGIQVPTVPAAVIHRQQTLRMMPATELPSTASSADPSQIDTEIEAEAPMILSGLWKNLSTRGSSSQSQPVATGQSAMGDSDPATDGSETDGTNRPVGNDLALPNEAEAENDLLSLPGKILRKEIAMTPEKTDAIKQLASSNVTSAPQIAEETSDPIDASDSWNQEINPLSAAKELPTNTDRILPASEGSEDISQSVPASTSATELSKPSKAAMNAEARSNLSSNLQETTFDQIRRIADAARLIHSGRSSEVILQLKPESLGRIQIRANLEGQQLTASILVETSQAEYRLKENLNYLRECLGDLGLRVQRVEVIAVSSSPDLSLPYGNQGEGGSGQSSQRQRQGTSAKEDTSFFYSEETEEPSSDLIRHWPANAFSGRIDLRF